MAQKTAKPMRKRRLQKIRKPGLDAAAAAGVVQMLMTTVATAVEATTVNPTEATAAEAAAGSAAAAAETMAGKQKDQFPQSNLHTNASVQTL